MSKQLHTALVFGGVSSEHGVSCVSAQTFMTHMLSLPERYDVVPIYIDRSGSWYLYEGDRTDLKNAPNGSYSKQVLISPGKKQKAISILSEEGLKTIEIDVVIPVLHGLNGEDGTVQGMLEMARLPYVGCGVMASALGMDKAFTKKIVSHLNIRQAEALVFTRCEIAEKKEELVQRTEEKFSYPVFVKPSRAGSSVGVSRAEDADELKAALDLAAREDRLVLVEELIRGHEVECAVMGNSRGTWVSDVGEVKAADTFYSFDAKYSNSESKTVIPAQIDEKAREEIRIDADRIFRAIDGEGLSRVDFFIEYETGEVIFNEINTFPGFTPISMWPMLMDHKGISVDEQIQKLIELALEREPSYGA